MELAPLTGPQQDDLIFSTKWDILCKIKSVTALGYRFYVYNGDWYGFNADDHSIVEVRTWGGGYDDRREHTDDFQKVLSLTSEDVEAYYYTRRAT
jgi:hypothetical protein